MYAVDMETLIDNKNSMIRRLEKIDNEKNNKDKC